jgi:iron complex outermembrane receptor protein
METARSIDIVSEQLIIGRGVLNLDNTSTYRAGDLRQPFGFATRSDWVRIRALDAPCNQDSLQSLFGNYPPPLAALLSVV